MNTYWAFYCLAWAAAVGWLALQLRKHRLPVVLAVDAAILSVPMALVGGHLAGLISYPREPGELRAMLLTLEGWRSGYVSFGGILGALLALAFVARLHHLPFFLLADLSAPAVLLATAIARVGCFFAGCCYGKPTNLPWAMSIVSPHGLVSSTLWVHPTQIYESILSSIAFGLIAYASWRRPYGVGRGVQLAVCFALYFAIRFLVEIPRIGGSSEVLLCRLSATQMGCATGVMVCAGLFFWCRRAVASRCEDEWTPRR